MSISDYLMRSSLLRLRHLLLVTASIGSLLILACGEAQTTAPPSDQEEVVGRFIKLVDALDEPEYYCVDVPGAGRGVRLQAALQAHTCKPLAEAADELFSLGHPGDGQIYMAAYDLCVEADGSDSVALLHLRPCSATPLQRFVHTPDGRIRLESDAPEVFCLSVSAEAGVPTGGPSHLRRDLALHSCGETGAPLSTWTVTNLWGGCLGVSRYRPYSILAQVSFRGALRLRSG